MQWMCSLVFIWDPGLSLILLPVCIPFPQLNCLVGPQWERMHLVHHSVTCQGRLKRKGAEDGEGRERVDWKRRREGKL